MEIHGRMQMGVGGRGTGTKVECLLCVTLRKLEAVSDHHSLLGTASVV